MNYETIIFEVKEQAAYITLNRPEAFNGLNLTVGKELMHAAIHCDESPEIRAVVLTGAGKAFSAGGETTPHIHELLRYAGPAASEKPPTLSLTFYGKSFNFMIHQDCRFTKGVPPHPLTEAACGLET
jgi:enoyl-CoA hydratase/carnithine racemase